MPVYTGFLKITLVYDISVHVCVCVWVPVCLRACVCVWACMCVPTLRLLITSGVIGTPYDWLNKLYSFYMAAVVIVIVGMALEMKCIE